MSCWVVPSVAAELWGCTIDAVNAKIQNGHIATRDEAAAQRFVQAIRSAVVMVNASSRFSDGGELGLGAEIGISTTRLHAYGPMGAEALTVERFVVRGDGQVRHSQSKL